MGQYTQVTFKKNDGSVATVSGYFHINRKVVCGAKCLVLWEKYRGYRNIRVDRVIEIRHG